MDSVFTIDAFALTIIVGTLLPTLVGVVTKLHASSALKSVALLFLAAVEGLLINATVLDGSAVFSTQTVVVAAVGWISAVASYYGLLKPTGVSPAVNDKTARFGLGSNH